jgi:hypothetical protein
VPTGFVVADGDDDDPAVVVVEPAVADEDDVVDGSVELELEPAVVVVDVESAVVDRVPDPREHPAASTARTRKTTRSFTAAHHRTAP